jgi:hypothetical protein
MWGGALNGLTHEEARRLFVEKLRSSCLTPKDADRYGVALVQTGDAQRRGYPVASAVSFWSIEFAYAGLGGKPLEDPPGHPYLRWRRLGPVMGPWRSKGEEDVPKYLQPRNTAPHPYLTPGLPWREVAANPHADLIITEGELKALCLNKYGRTTIALGGVDSFRSKKLEIDFLPELDAFEWEGRRVTLLFDSDAASKARVRHARRALAERLTLRRALVYVKELPES